VKAYFFVLLLVGSVLGFSAFYSLAWNLNLPTKWLNPLGQEICVLDARGEKILNAPKKYHVGYAEECPTRDRILADL